MLWWFNLLCEAGGILSAQKNGKKNPNYYKWVLVFLAIHFWPWAEWGPENEGKLLRVTGKKIPQGVYTLTYTNAPPPSIKKTLKIFSNFWSGASLSCWQWKIHLIHWPFAIREKKLKCRRKNENLDRQLFRKKNSTKQSKNLKKPKICKHSVLAYCSFCFIIPPFLQ